MEYVEKHSESHLCCLVGGKKGPDFREEAQKYINSIFTVEVVSFPGLNTRKLLGMKWEYNPLRLVHTGEPSPIPGGKHEGLTVPEVVSKFSSSKTLAIIYSSNNRNFFDGTVSVENALFMFFAELNILLQNCNFENLYISTIFPRGEDVSENGGLVSQISEFNYALLLEKTRYLEKYKIFGKNEQGSRKMIQWVPINMVETLPYGEMRNLKFYCSNNYKKPHYKRDLTHVNAVYLELFLRKLKDTYIKNVRTKKLNKKKNKKNIN